jgi:hypothetical protein
MDGFFIAAVFIGIPWVLGSIYRANLAHLRFMKTLQLKAEMSARLIDRMGTEPQVLEFLKSDIQQQIFDVKQTGISDRIPTGYNRTLTSVQAGIVLLTAGAALLVVRPNMHVQSHEEMLFLGALGVALGVGALLSAVATLALSRVWRALEETRA